MCNAGLESVFRILFIDYPHEVPYVEVRNVEQYMFRGSATEQDEYKWRSESKPRNPWGSGAAYLPRRYFTYGLLLYSGR